MTTDNLRLKIENYYGEIETEIYNLKGNKISKQNGAFISLKDFKRNLYLKN